MPLIKEHVYFRFIPTWVVPVCLFISGCGSSPTQTSKPVVAESASEREYGEMLSRITRWDNGQEFDGFGMDTEHLFVEDEELRRLRDQIVFFDRAPGSLDLLFSKVMRKDAGPKEILAVAQLLVFFAEWQDDSDRQVTSQEAATMLKSLDRPQLVAAERCYPNAGITRIIAEACEKVIQGHQVLLGRN